MKGVLYFVWGKFDRLLQRSIDSLQKSNPGLPHHVVRLPDGSSYLDKAAMYAESPFDVTAYLDSDTVIFGNLNYAFERAEKFGLACCINESPWARRYEGLKDSGDEVEYNAGVVFFDKTKSKPFFDAWQACVREIDSSSEFLAIEGIRRQGCNDQAGMTKAMVDTGFNPFILPLNWNLRPAWHRSYVGPIKIWHDYHEPPAELIRRSGEGEKSRVFDTVYMHDKSERKQSEDIPIRWVMSVPRLGFQDNFFCGSQISAKHGIYPTRYTGAFWGQCLERTMMNNLDGEWILSTDYDSVFTLEDFEKLAGLMASSPEADAIAGVQLRRRDHAVLAGILGQKKPGDPPRDIPIESYGSELLKVHIAHFGFTMLRVEALKKMEHPWFLNVPNKDGLWEEGKQDEDVYFWRKWNAAGNSLYLANRIPIGHIEAFVTWPNNKMQATYQFPVDFWMDGKPENVWKGLIETEAASVPLKPHGNKRNMVAKLPSPARAQKLAVG